VSDFKQSGGNRIGRPRDRRGDAGESKKKAAKKKKKKKNRRQLKIYPGSALGERKNKWPFL